MSVVSTSERTRSPLPAPAWRGGFYLSNGMYCVWGRDESVALVDVYLTRRMEYLVAMRHVAVPPGAVVDEERLRRTMDVARSQFEAAASRRGEAAS